MKNKKLDTLQRNRSENQLPISISQAHQPELRSLWLEAGCHRFSWNGDRFMMELAENCLGILTWTPLEYFVAGTRTQHNKTKNKQRVNIKRAPMNSWKGRRRKAKRRRTSPYEDQPLCKTLINKRARMWPMPDTVEEPLCTMIWGARKT